jgi:hypothetical protein
MTIKIKYEIEVHFKILGISFHKKFLYDEWERMDRMLDIIFAQSLVKIVSVGYGAVPVLK